MKLNDQQRDFIKVLSQTFALSSILVLLFMTIIFPIKELIVSSLGVLTLAAILRVTALRSKNEK